MKKLALHWQIAIGLLIGVLYGLFLPDHLRFIAWMGDVFLSALRMIIVPLILTSIFAGIANIGRAEELGRLGFKTILYYLSTSVLAILTGLLLVNVIRPGVGADLGLTSDVEGLSASAEGFGSTLIQIVPQNIFEAMRSDDMLSIIFFAIVMGFFATRLEEPPRKTIVDFVNAAFELIMKVTHFIILFTPLGVLAIVAVVVAEQAGDRAALIEVAQRMGLYMVCVLGGLAIHFFVTLAADRPHGRKGQPWLHYKAMSVPLLTAWSTSSSSATLPLTMEAVEKNAGVSNKVTSFVLPLGATVNMDGTALYECVAAMFIAQAYGISLGFGQQVLVVFTAVLASIGAAGIPMAGLVMITVILTAVGLPLEGVGLILAVDRILDMFRTATNVFSDSCGAVVIARTEGETLTYDRQRGQMAMATASGDD